VVDAPGGALRVRLPDGTDVDDLLRRHGLAPLAERVPVVAYGANRSPASLALKLRHHGYDDGTGAPVAVPVLAGTLAGFDVVAAAYTGQGYVYADIAPSPGTSARIMVTLLDPGQAAAVHDSEGVRTAGAGYDCAWVPGLTVAGVGLRALAYAGCLPVFVSPRTGSPLAFAAIGAGGRRFEAFDQVDLVAEILTTTGILEEVADLVGAPGAPPDARAVAVDLARTLNGQWWYAHHNPGVPRLPRADAAQAVVNRAIRAHAPGPTTSERLRPDGRVLDADTAYEAGPGLRLGAVASLVPT
jgi:hypothetical protein